MKQTIKVEGMRCEHCEARVEQTLSKMEGVASVKASHEKSCVEVEYDPAKVSATELADTIEDCGYSVTL